MRSKSTELIPLFFFLLSFHFFAEASAAKKLDAAWTSPLAVGEVETFDSKLMVRKKADSPSKKPAQVSSGVKKAKDIAIPTPKTPKVPKAAKAAKAAGPTGERRGRKPKKSFKKEASADCDENSESSESPFPSPSFSPRSPTRSVSFSEQEPVMMHQGNEEVLVFQATSPQMVNKRLFSEPTSEEEKEEVEMIGEAMQALEMEMEMEMECSEQRQTGWWIPEEYPQPLPPMSLPIFAPVPSPFKNERASEMFFGICC